MSEWQGIIDYWFGTDDPPSQSYFKLWFSGGDAADKNIHDKFKSAHAAVVAGEHKHWLDDPLGRLASIITIDQFSRNLYRAQAEAFAWDHLALKWAIEGWQNRVFEPLTMSQKMFAAMPLVHSENLLSQDYALEICERLRSKSEPSNEMLSSFYSSIQEHRDIIVQFGRYPHRNDVLGRIPTRAEVNYLTSGAKRFGQ